MKAAQRANRYIDSMELMEKSVELSKLAKDESTRLEKLDSDLQALVRRRMSVNLHTPKSGMTSADAYNMLCDFNQTVRDSVSMFDRALMKHTVEEDIVQLQKSEIAWAESEANNEQVQTKYDAQKKRKGEIYNELRVAIEAEEDALRALELAQKRVVQTKIALSDAIQDISKVQIQAKKSTEAARRASKLLARNSERVRKALCKKEKAVLKQRILEANDTLTTEEREERILQLKQLREKELEMRKERSRIEAKAAELLSQADELKKRAEELEIAQ